MTRFDTFPYSGEADMLEARLVELQEVSDLVHVIVEADVSHGGNTPKPYHYLDQRERFAPWADRIIYVQATNLPDDPDPWTREHAQREWALVALRDADPDDIVFHGDVDEIPTALAARYVQPVGTAVLVQRFHPFAVDWRHPQDWRGTTATRLKNITTMSALRDARLSPHSIPVPDAGWHFSWVGDGTARHRKLDIFCHQEIRSTWEPHIEDCWASGLHVDGSPLEPVVVDDSWPRWVRDGECPDSWFRPHSPTRRPEIEPALILGPQR